MSRTVWHYLKVVSLWAALMSGAASIIREFVGLYQGNAGNPKGWFWASVWICFVIASGVAWFIEHQEVLQLQKQLDKEAERIAIRERLGQQLASGSNLLLRLADRNNNLEELDREFERWHTDTQEYLAQSVGGAYLARWRNDAGLTVNFPATLIPTPYQPVEPQRRHLYTLLHCRIVRLNQIVEEFSR